MSELKSGWNTWNTRSVLSHVHLPEGFAISLGIKSYHSGGCLREALIGRQKKEAGGGTSGPQGLETIVPGPHAYDGSFTSLELEWDGVRMRVETAVRDDDWFAVVTPLSNHVKTPCLTIEAGVLWGRPGYARREGDRLLIHLCWGSNPYEARIGHILETVVLNTKFASMLESGLDNSPMYKEVGYDKQRNLMALADVGLMSFYITDCRELADLAGRIGRNDVVPELEQRVDKYSGSLRSLWCEETGLFLNKHMDTGELQHRLSPTHFYPLLAEVPTQEQAERMINEHFFNPDEFWGDWILPSIARNDPMYPEQDYWRGRIWAPMNFLVYLGIRKYDLPEARTALVEKSEALLLKEWRDNRHVHENYCGDTGMGCGSGKQNSDAFYHWGGLLGLISVLEAEG